MNTTGKKAKKPLAVTPVVSELTLKPKYYETHEKTLAAYIHIPAAWEKMN